MYVCIYYVRIHACMYVCMYVCVCIHVCMHVCTYARMRVRVCMYVYVRTYAFMYVLTYACVHICMYLCMHIYVCTMYVFMYVCMYIICYLRNIPTGCTYVFRTTVTTPPRSIAIALLGPLWLINVPENKKIISSNGLFLNYTKAFRNNEMQVQFLRAKRPIRIQ